MLRRLAAALVLLSFTAQAADLKLPEYKEEAINGQIMACYDFDGAKKLRLLQNDCLTLSVQLEELRDAYSDLQKAVVLLKQSETELEAVNVHLTKDLKEAQAQRDSEVKAVIRAKENSVWGGGFVWVVVGFALGAAAGGYGVYVLTKH